MRRVIKPKNQRVKRALEHREPKLIENVKNAMFIRGGNTSEVVTQTLKELYSLKKPEAILFKRKNITRPFEDATSIEFFSQKNDSSLFLFGSHSKKRPHNLILGRLFDFHVLDMIELGVLRFTSWSKFKTAGCVLGSKPCLLFSGDLFETDFKYMRLKNLLMDFFRGVEVTKVRLEGLDHVLSFTEHEGRIYMRVYRILLKKSGGSSPRVELEEMGPSLDIEVRRSQVGSTADFKKACRQPKANKVKKTKNVSRDTFGTKFGRVHMQRQDFSKFQTRKIKGLRKPKEVSSKQEPAETRAPRKPKDVSSKQELTETRAKRQKMN